jgi:uncharacterized membrane-anchored protein
MNFNLEQVPEWASSWCYFFAAMGLFSLVSGFSVFFVGNKLGAGMTILYLLATLTQAATAMTLFWMCRTSLNTGSRNAGCGKSPWYGTQ